MHSVTRFSWLWAVIASTPGQAGRFSFGGCVSEFRVQRGWVTSIYFSHAPLAVGGPHDLGRSNITGIYFSHAPLSVGGAYDLGRPSIGGTSVRRDDLHGP